MHACVYAADPMADPKYEICTHLKPVQKAKEKPDLAGRTLGGITASDYVCVMDIEPSARERI